MSRIVWVLGSGFSVPLGGPTLASLFSRPSFETMLHVYNGGSSFVGAGRDAAWKNVVEGPRSHALRVARDLFDYGRDPGRAPGMLWRDPEDFLDQLDTATSARSPLAARFKAAIARVHQDDDLTLRDLLKGARRLLALECSLFLLNADTSSERWDPYQRWLRILSAEETIITFNYDLVPEKLGLRGSLVLPGSALPTDVPILLKLHGSVGWVRRGDTWATAGEASEDHNAAAVHDDDLAIAPPGPEKKKTAQALEPLWALAEQRLRAAHAIVFIGYRFPETDSYARQRLLGALEQSTARIHVALGDDVNHPHARRMHSLLKFATRKPERIYLHPLWSQDFLSLYQPHALLAPSANA